MELFAKEGIIKIEENLFLFLALIVVFFLILFLVVTQLKKFHRKDLDFQSLISGRLCLKGKLLSAHIQHLHLKSSDKSHMAYEILSDFQYEIDDEIFVCYDSPYSYHPTYDIKIAEFIFDHILQENV